MLFERKMKCNGCGAVMPMSASRCPGCGVVITQIDDEKLTYSEIQNRSLKNNYKNGVKFMFNIYFSIILFFVVVVLLLFIMGLFS